MFMDDNIRNKDFLHFDNGKHLMQPFFFSIIFLEFELPSLSERTLAI